jgi:geranylgeranyl pyrophosphate synthase
MGHFAESIGIAFQMQDDVLDLTGKEFAEKKGGLGQDITEGKRTLMVICALKNANAKDKKRLVEILNMHTSNQTLRDEAIAILQKYGAIEYTRNKAAEIVEESWVEVDKLLKPTEGKEKLKAFAEFLIKRSI